MAAGYYSGFFRWLLGRFGQPVARPRRVAVLWAQTTQSVTWARHIPTPVLWSE